MGSVHSESIEKYLYTIKASFLLGVCFRKKKDVGADILVAGTVIINSKDYAETIKNKIKTNLWLIKIRGIFC